jgi:hypothetical protein
VPLGIGFDLFGEGGQLGHRNTKSSGEALSRVPFGVGTSALNEGKGLGSEAGLFGKADLGCTAFDPKLANCQTEGGLGMFGAFHAVQKVNRFEAKYSYLALIG